MATASIDERHVKQDVKILWLKLTADGSGTVTYALPAGTVILGVTNPVKTTGTAADVHVTYVESTGVLTVVTAANNVVRFGVFLQ